MDTPLRLRMIGLLRDLAPEEGYTLTPLPDVRLLRADRPLSLTPVLYEPGIVIVVQGRKRGFLGDDVFIYDEQHYLVVSVPVPFTMETDASADEPLLAIYFRLDHAMAAELCIQIDERHGPSAAPPRGLYSSPMEDALAASVLRLLEALTKPPEGEVLGPALVREIYYRILSGAQGGSLRAALAQQGKFGMVARAIRMIHSRYSEMLTVDELASEAAMSPPTFHAHFRAMTGTSPMRYVQSTRLHQARLLMLRQHTTAAAAATAVGYESASQFSREFRRLFGRPPIEEVERMRRNFAMPAALTPSAFVSSH
ncbi:AraC family transcriptional regulator [Luteibacter sp. OK325]|uniref:AraC family transcriptional regulator n=1 Tax=Luteibacter sp. OK325 TaxID=2135670 RepID=UPI000D436460|nr:AraC family transcriptional regulator [Luteibacter sp. OK325]PTR32501.1 AraC family transcriptional regulator [Luteibacter sp. OK325]